ncbi:Hint domain-containing protein [Frigidibacter sp. MR17.14]|uniref:Hint domain-containing protein n=1 Tax=Frigidibacter sp. MR17.14 TaxID=3126509 RepID=UPI003012A275
MTQPHRPYPPRPDAGVRAPLVPSLSPATALKPERRPLRAMPLARRYEASYLMANGDIGSVSRLAPAMPMFEQAFAAIARGTLVATTQGPVAVQDLLPGDILVTAEGDSSALLWTGQITLYPAGSAETERTASQGSEAARLTRIMAESFGMGRPLADVVLGPHARLLRRDPKLVPIVGRDSAYLPVRALQDGERIFEVAPATPVSVHHLVLANQATLSAGGIGIESFHPGENLATMMDPQLLHLFLSLFPHLPDHGGGIAGFGAEAHPRLTRFEAEDLLVA